MDRYTKAQKKRLHIKKEEIPDDILQSVASRFDLFRDTES